MLCYLLAWRPMAEMGGSPREVRRTGSCTLHVRRTREAGNDARHNELFIHRANARGCVRSRLAQLNEATKCEMMKIH
jgi:hypothetical protein